MVRMGKDRWISVKVSGRIAETVKTVAGAMGISVSEFTRQALLERLERLNLVSSEVKEILAREGADTPPLRGRSADLCGRGKRHD